MREAITNNIRAGYPGVYLVSHEETRAEAELKAAAAATELYHCRKAITLKGLFHTQGGTSVCSS